MEEAKYTKFRRNVKAYANDDVWSYTALNEKNNEVLVIKVDKAFKSDLPCEISSGVMSQFNVDHLEGVDSHEITEKEFWAAYKLYLVRLIEYLKKHTNGEEAKKE